MGKKIVIADDEPITIMDISEILTEEGYNVVAEVSDGFDAIEACRQHRPDLILLDIKMPLLNGIKAARIIKKEAVAESIVFLTAYIDILPARSLTLTNEDSLKELARLSND